MTIFLKNGHIFTGNNNEITKGNMLIKDGKIEKIGNFELDFEPDKVIDAEGKLIMPGLINAHSHSYAGLLKGSMNNTPLDIYMLHAIAGGSFRSPEEIYTSTMIDALQMLKTGTTSVIDHFSERPKVSLEGIGSAVKAYLDSGIRATVAPMYSDKSYFDTVPMEKNELPKHLLAKQSDSHQTPDEYIEVCEAAINKYHNHNDRIRMTIGTDGPQRCSDELLKKTAELEDKYKVGWHSHLLEAKTQAVMGHKLHGMGLVEKLDELNMINERTSLVHFVWGSEKEKQIILDRKANMIHCPYSNLFIGVGIPNIVDFYKSGMNIAIGSDGGNIGNLNMFEKIRLTSIIHRVYENEYRNWISAENVWELALKGGSRAMQLQNEIGSLEVGKKADFLILNIKNIFWEPINSIIRQLTYYENGSSIESVFVEGKEVIHKGKSTLIDEEDIMKRAEISAKRIYRDNREAFEMVAKQEPYFRKMYLRVAEQDFDLNK